MQFSVPQFVEVEDKIIGPLTLKQFFILLAGAGGIFVLYQLIPSFILFLLAALPVGAVAVILAFGQFNGRSLGALALSAMGFFSESRSFVFRKGADLSMKVTKLKKPAAPSKEAPQETAEEKLSRLHKLTYILDQDIKAERELIQEKFVNLK